MKKKVYQDCLVEVMEMIRWEFEGSDQAHVIKDLDDILKKHKIEKKMRKLFAEFQRIEKTI